MAVLIIDNNDSFTFNLAQLYKRLSGRNAKVKNYFDISIEDLKEHEQIIISPGPGLPNDFPKYLEWFPILKNSTKVLGVCMGHEMIATYSGARLKKLKSVRHGMKKEIFVNNENALFLGMEAKIEIGLYHSWVVDRKTLPLNLSVIAEDDEGEIMGIQHRDYNFTGIQFHPESYMTDFGSQIMANWLVKY